MVFLDNKKNIKSFGRIGARGVDKEKISDKYFIDLDHKLDKNKINHLEIGFGYGESIVERAIKNVNINYIGCEVYTKGIANLINLIEKNNVRNISIFNGDARLLMENLTDKSLDMVFILFPDPWPKKRHHKRRIINGDFLNIISNKLKIGGRLFFASDIDDYVSWSIENVDNSGCFKRLFDENNCGNEPDWWIKTKYQVKAIGENRSTKFLEWENLGHFADEFSHF
jgi:tRNA (guanine-N7-)-methyltransferase